MFTRSIAGWMSDGQEFFNNYNGTYTAIFVTANDCILSSNVSSDGDIDLDGSTGTIPSTTALHNISASVIA